MFQSFAVRSEQSERVCSLRRKREGQGFLVSTLSHGSRMDGIAGKGEDVVSKKALQKRPLCARNWQKRRIFGPKSGGFSGFMFTDKYIWTVEQNIYYLSLAWMNPSL